MKIIGLIQARMNSKRLPGKVVMDLNGLPVLQHIYRRLLSCKELDQVVVSVGTANCKPILDICDKYAMVSRVGEEEDLLARHLGVGIWHHADAIVRVTADCLFHDPELIDRLVALFRANWPGTRGWSTWPRRRYSEGLDADVWSMELLQQLSLDQSVPRENWAGFVCSDTAMALRLSVCPGFSVDVNDGEPHLSIDTKEDLDRAEKMLKILGNDEFRYAETLKAYREVTKCS